MAGENAVVVLEDCFAARAFNGFALFKSGAVSDQMATVTKAIRQVFDLNYDRNCRSFVIFLSLLDVGT